MKPNVNEFYCITDIYKPYYYQMPKGLFVYEKYRDLDVLSKVVYSILLDRIALSKKNKWIDKYGRIYLCFKQQELGELLNANRSTISRSMKKLEEYDLIKCEEQGRGHTNRIYLKKLIVPMDESEINNAEDNLGQAELEAEELDRQENPEFSCAPVQPARAKYNISVESGTEPCAPAHTSGAPMHAAVAPAHTPCAPVHTRIRMNNLDLLSNTDKREDLSSCCSSNARADNEADITKAEQEVIDFYAQNIHPEKPILPFEKDMLIQYCRETSVEWVNAAIKQTLLNGKNHLGYIQGVLKNWQEYGFGTQPEKEKNKTAGSNANRFNKKQNTQSIQESTDEVVEILKQWGAV